MKKLFYDPLLHFLLIGALLFILFELLKEPTANIENTIVVTSSDITVLQANFARTWQRSPTPQELTGLITEKIRDEMAYREAVAMGLDKNDGIIKKRLRAKLDLLVEDMNALYEPSDEELEKYLKENRQAYLVAPIITFRQIYLNSELRGEKVNNDARSLLGDLQSAGADADISRLGDPTMLPSTMKKSSVYLIKRQFGRSFGQKILELETGKWVGPVSSSYGLHVIYIDEFLPGRLPELTEVRKEVERDWLLQQGKKIKEESYKRLAEQYSVVIEPTPSAPDAKLVEP